MGKYIILGLLFFGFELTMVAQNTVFNNVAIGIDYPAYGAKIKTNFPGYTGGWGRAYFITNETGDQSFFTFGSSGYSTNGVSSVTSSYIGKDLDTRYMTFLPNGNIGIATNNPQAKLQIGEFNSNGASKISVPGVYNFEEMRLGQYGNGASGVEMITHTNQVSSFGVRLFASTDTGSNGLLIQTANPASSAQDLIYTTKLAVNINGNVGIGTTSPDEKLTVKGKIHTQEVKVDMLGSLVPDYVFANDYQFKSLSEIESYIKKNNHLPEIPSANEIEKNGLQLAEMNMSLLKKVEELTLYAIEQEKKINNQSAEIETLKQENASFKNLSERLSRIETIIKAN